MFISLDKAKDRKPTMPRIGTRKITHGDSLGEAIPRDRGFSHLAIDNRSPRVATLREANHEDVAKVMDMDLQHRKARAKQKFQHRCPRLPCHGQDTFPWAR